MEMGRTRERTRLKTLRYVNARETDIASDRKIPGGTSVLGNTRVKVHSVLARRKDGKSLDEIASDQPSIPRAVFETAAIRARANPLAGLPKRPWH